MADATTASLINLGIALGIGLLIGIERGWTQRDHAAGTRVAGVRTFGLLGLAGGLIGLLATGPAFWLGVAAMAGIAGLVVMGYRHDAASDPAGLSMTGALVAIMTVMLGIAATLGFTRAAIISAGATLALLTSRVRLHRWLATLDDTDIRATAQFAVIAMVILPLLPNENFGPYAAFNPRNLWLVVVFVTGISFAGYLASKRLGSARGTLAASAIGATYSSTAVTAELSRRLHKADANAAILQASIAAATVAMLLRVLVLTAILVPGGFTVFATIVAPAALVALVIALWRARQLGVDDRAPLPATNPFSVGPAIGFAVMVGVIVLASKWAIARFGDNGLTTLLALTGLYDVDSAIITVGNLDPNSISGARSGFVLAIPILVNSVLKAIIVVVLAGPKRGLRAAVPLVLSALVLAAGLVLNG
jgi:uncharacterized membrane protein (DUF4010 family)